MNELGCFVLQAAETPNRIGFNRKEVFQLL